MKGLSTARLSYYTIYGGALVVRLNGKNTFRVIIHK
jgi:hypothetical protein